jgi:hypothetical protein
METVLTATPLKNGLFTKEHEFSNGMTIRPIGPILWEMSVAKPYMSDNEREVLSNINYWLCVENQWDSWTSSNSEPNYRTHLALIALQVLCPRSSLNVHMRFWKRANGFDHVGSSHPKEMKSTPLGRFFTYSESEIVQKFVAASDGVLKAESDQIIRLMNPLVLLEHGLQIDHVYLSTLMWVMGLDMLFMACNRNEFGKRIKRFLGAATKVFPPVSLNFPFCLTVEELVDDLYDIRSEIAHGRPIPERFRKPFRPELDNEFSLSFYADTSYSEFLRQGALRILTLSLEKIFLNNLVTEVASTSKWRSIVC